MNEGDHLRIQCAAPVLSLNAPFAMASRIDDLVESKLDIAFDERMGYLTSCPTNLGTGLRASVVLHLPGLAFTNNIDSIINISPQLGLAVRGLFGNGSEVIGNLYQISNQLTLGFTENELLENLKSAASEIVSRERQARKALEMYAKDRVEDAAWRAYGIMKYARYIASGEVLALLGRVKLGADLGLLNELDSKFFSNIFINSSLISNLPTIERRVNKSSPFNSLISNAIYIFSFSIKLLLDIRFSKGIHLLLIARVLHVPQRSVQ